MLKELVKIANRLDSLGLTREADVLDRWINKVAAGAPRVTSNFDPSKIKRINEAADSIIAAMKAVVNAGSLPSMRGVLSLSRENPFINQFNYITRTPSGVNITDANIRGLLVQAYDHSGGNYSEVPDAEKHLFENVVVAGAQTAVKNNRSYIVSGPVAPESKPNTSGVQAQTGGTTYPRPAPTATPKRTPTAPTKPSPSTPKRDWAYYLSKQPETNRIGKNMEILWSRASKVMGSDPGYASFVSWYKSKRKNMGSAEATREMFADAMLKTKDPFLSALRDSRAKEDPKAMNAMYYYIGFNPETYMPASVVEQQAAKQRLEAIKPAMDAESDAEAAGAMAEDFRKTRVSEE